MSQSIVESLKGSFANAVELNRTDLERIYTNDIVFVDPIGRVEGLDKLSAYFDGVYKNVQSCRFEYLDELIGPDKASIKWDMHFTHPKIAAGKEIKVRGVSLLEFKDKVHHHEDIYDVGALMYEHIPVLGGPVRWLKRRVHRLALQNLS